MADAVRAQENTDEKTELGKDEDEDANSNAVDIDNKKDQVMDETSPSPVRDRTPQNQVTEETSDDKDVKEISKDQEVKRTSLDPAVETTIQDEEVKESSKDLAVKDTSEDRDVEQEVQDKNDNSNNNKNETDIKTSKKVESDKEKPAVGASKDDNNKKTAAVDLKSLKPNYNARMKTTLPDILTEYGMEDPNKPPAKVKTKKKKKRKTEQEGDEDDDTNKRKSRDEKFRQTFGDSRQTDTYYMEYLDFLEKKVQEERLKAIKTKEEEARKALQQVEEEQSPVAEKVAPPVVEEEEIVDDLKERQKRFNIRRLERVELRHDDSFIRGLHKTDLTRIVALQDKLVKQGKLKTQVDLDLFWQDIRKPDVFFSHFKVKMNTEPAALAPSGNGSEPGGNHLAPMQRQPDMAPRMLSNISETSKGDKESWAITQKFASNHGDRTPSPEKQRKNSSQLAKEAAVDLERRCPKLEMPPLSCFSLKLGEKPPDPEEIQRRIELKQREKNRKKSQRKLNKMYQMAMTHSAAANRILANHGDLLSLVEGAALRDVLSVFDEPYTIDDYYRDVTDPSRAVEVHPDMDRGYEPASPGSRRTSAGSSGSRTKTPPSRPASTSLHSQKIILEKIEAPPPLPLSFNEILVKEKTMEPKCLSTNWSNYMHVGKSVFSTS